MIRIKEIAATGYPVTDIARARKPSSDGPAVPLEVEDFEAAVTHLRATAVKFHLEPMDSGVCHMAIVADPDGNSLVIHKRRAS